MKQFFNKAQQYLLTVAPKDMVCVCGRGFGKGILHAYVQLRNFQRMPGCNVGFVGASCKRCLTNTLPSMLIHWERWGFKRDKHWCIGHKPAKNGGWGKPIFEPANYDNVISFYNGSIGTIISQDRTGTSNSLSLDAIDIDEAKFIDYNQLKDETFQANRGNAMFFGKHYCHHGMLITSDMPVTKKGSWFLKYKDECDMEAVRLIEGLVHKIWRRKKYLADNPLDDDARIRLHQDYATLSKLRSQVLLYKEYSSIENLAILGEEFVKRMRRDLPPLTFATSIMCRRLTVSMDGFYSALSSDNLYSSANTHFLDGLDYDFDKLKEVDSRMDGDLQNDRPLVIAFDANANINWMVVGQVGDDNVLRVLKSFWVKYERKLPELIDDFCKYYFYFGRKEVVFYYDATFVGNNYALQNDDFSSFIKRALKQNGWYVREMYIGNPMQHIPKALLINRMLKGQANHYVQINKDNNPDLLISVQTAGVYNGKKDKRGEKLAETEEDKLESRTDGSDAFDTLCIGVEKFPVQTFKVAVTSSF